MIDEKMQTHLSKKIVKAIQAAEHNAATLKRIAKIIELETLDESESAELFILSLQYRLDGEDVIKALINADRNLCLALGISSQNTKERNLDLLHYYLGKSNTAHDFSILLGLDRQLLKALNLNEQMAKLLLKERQRLESLAKELPFSEEEEEVYEKKEKKKKTLKEGYAHYKADSVASLLREAIGFQNFFHLFVEALTGSIQDIGHVPKYGVQYDYLAGLKGPISRFYQAYLNGIGICESIIEHVEKSLPTLENKRKLLLHSTLQKIVQKRNTALQTQILEASNRLNQAERLQASQKVSQANELVNNQKFNEAAHRRRTMRWF